MTEHLNHAVTAIQGAALSAGGALVLSQAVPDFSLPPWARDSLAMVAMLFLGWLLLTERRENRNQMAAMATAHAVDIAAAHKDKTERLEAIYRSRIEEAREYATQLDAVRRDQHEHTQRLYQDLIQIVTKEKQS